MKNKLEMSENDSENKDNIDNHLNSSCRIESKG